LWEKTNKLKNHQSMKKQILTCMLAAGITSAAFAQGNVNWTGPSFSAITAQTNTTQLAFGGGASGLANGTIGATISSTAGPDAFYYELLVGSTYSGAAATAPSSATALASWTDSGLSANNGSVAGRLAVVNGNAGATVNALSATGTNNIILVGWSANLGTTWSAALTSLKNPATIVGTGLFGESTVGYIEGAGTTVSPGASVFGSAASANGLPIYSLNTQLEVVTVPEPGTLALAALGGASLLMFRRKK
jgi:hypothetical protein